MFRIRNKNTNQVHICQLKNNGEYHIYLNGTLDFYGEWENLGGFNKPFGKKFTDNWEIVEKKLRVDNGWNTYFLKENGEWILLKPEQDLNCIRFDKKNIILKF
jgi:hypothetical protein